MKKVKYLIIGLTLCTLTISNLFAQDNTKETTDSISTDLTNQKVFDKVEKQPEFPGGSKNLHSFISSRLRYPKNAFKKGIEGVVVCSFIVSSTGKVEDIQVVRSVHPTLDTEAINVLKLMPKWEPGETNGVAVDVYFTLPIRFKLPLKK